MPVCLNDICWIIRCDCHCCIACGKFVISESFTRMKRGTDRNNERILLFIIAIVERKMITSSGKKKIPFTFWHPARVFIGLLVRDACLQTTLYYAFAFCVFLNAPFSHQRHNGREIDVLTAAASFLLLFFSLYIQAWLFSSLWRYFSHLFWYMRKATAQFVLFRMWFSKPYEKYFISLQHAVDAHTYIICSFHQHIDGDGEKNVCASTILHPLQLEGFFFSYHDEYAYIEEQRFLFLCIFISINDNVTSIQCLLVSKGF